jgi:hypothetical protein
MGQGGQPSLSNCIADSSHPTSLARSAFAAILLFSNLSSRSSHFLADLMGRILTQALRQGVAMKRKTMSSWFQACLVGSAMTTGCNRQEVPLAKNDGDLLSPVSAWAQKDPRQTVSAAKRPDPALMQTSYPGTDPATAVTAKPALPTSAIPPIVFADPSETAKPAPVQEMPKPLSAATVATAMRVHLEAGKPPSQDEIAMGMGRYGHAPDYTWLRGEVQSTRRGWHLRYASMDEADPHGGSVMLADNGQLSDLKEGEVFVVKGRLQDPDSHASAPVYMVSEVRAQR